MSNFSTSDFEFWKHYVDDVLDSVQLDFDVTRFLDYLNSFEPRIKFTVESQEGSEFSFLDIRMITNEDGSVETSVYRKKTHTNLYSNFNSFCHFKAKSSVIQCSTRRALNYCSSDELLKEELALVENVAVANGWMRSDARAIIVKTEDRVYKDSFLKLRDADSYEQEKAKKRQDQKEKIRMAIPFPGQKLASHLTRVCAKYNIAPAFSSVNTIKSNLVHLKDPVSDLQKSGVVYQIPLNCGKSYIGETDRLWQKRKEDHIGYLKGMNVRDSAILDHLLNCQKDCGHPSPGVMWDSCKILEQETHKVKRQALESIHIKANGSSVINRNDGTLSGQFDRVLQTGFSVAQSGRSVRPGQAIRFERRRRREVTMTKRVGLSVNSDLTTMGSVVVDRDLTSIKAIP
tara:strand:- start:194 stop:1396 length:1203 start_codon:yes stop_codon:yes gene_type:complete